MKEIGGFLEFEMNTGHEFHEDCIALNSGRNCLRYLIRVQNISKIWLPKLLCSAISDTCKEENVEICYYSIDEYLKPVLSGVPENEWLYLINYYGQYTDNEIIAYAERYKNIIVDNAQAFYNKPVSNLDTLYTCRKFFGVPDGGYLYTVCKNSFDLQVDESYDRIQFLAGRFEKSANEFYAAYRKNEEAIDTLPLKVMSRMTKNLLCGVNYEDAAKKRENNFGFLHQHLKNVNRLDNIIIPKGPYMYPFLVRKGSELRAYLQKEKIYIPLLWPNVKRALCSEDIEYQLADNILPLPCDQRYFSGDMMYMLEKIKRMEGLWV